MQVEGKTPFRRKNKNGTAIAVPFKFKSYEFEIYLVGVARKRRARKITAINTMPIITKPGAPNSSPMPVFGKAVEVGTMVSWAIAACVKAAPTVARYRFNRIRDRGYFRIRYLSQYRCIRWRRGRSCKAGAFATSRWRSRLVALVHSVWLVPRLVEFALLRFGTNPKK